MLAWTPPDRPLVGCAAFRMPIWGLYVFTRRGTLARVLLPPYVVDTRCVGDLALPLGCGLGAECARHAAHPSLVPSPGAARCNFAPSSVETCWGGEGAG
jgi:hypothetical protein